LRAVRSKSRLISPVPYARTSSISFPPTYRHSRSAPTTWCAVYSKNSECVSTPFPARRRSDPRK
jgi:hypothetical protein